MISHETDPTAHQRELSTSDKVNLINEIITEEVFAVDASTDFADIAVKIADNIDKARNRVRFLPNKDVYFEYLEAIFGDISDAAGVENAAIDILETAQSLIEAGVAEGITADTTSYSSKEIGRLTAMLRQQISEEKARAAEADAPTDDPEIDEDDDFIPPRMPYDPEDDLDFFDDDDDFFADSADPDIINPRETTNSYNFDRINFAFEIARRRLERQALEKARQNKEAFTTHAQIRDALKQMYDAYQKHEDHDTYFAQLADALGLNGIADADTKEKIEAALREGIDFTLFDSLDSIGNELQKIENGTVDNPKNQLVTLKNSLLKLVTNLDSQLTVDADASADFVNVKAEFLAAVQLLMQDYLLRYEAVAPAFAKPELQSIINALQAVIQGNLDPQDPAIRNILRPDADGGANPFDTTSFITKGLSPAELNEQTRVVQNLEQKVAIVLGDEDRANKYENLTFTQSLEEILQLVEVVDVDPSLIIQVEQYWSQFLVGSDAAGGFDLAACFADTDLHAVAALQTKLTIQRNQIIQSFIDNELTPEQNQLAIEAVCVIDLCRNRLRVLLVEVADAHAAALASQVERGEAEADSDSDDAEAVLPPYETTDSNEKQYLGYTLAQMINTYHEGSANVNAWLNVFSYKLKELGNSDEAKELRDFLNLFMEPLAEGFFKKNGTIDAQQLTAVRGENFIELISDKIAVYDEFRKSKDYQTIITPVGDLASLIMLKTYFKTKSIDGEDKLVVEGSHVRARVEVAKLLGIEVDPDTGIADNEDNDNLLSEALKMLVKYEKNKKTSTPVDFGSPLVTAKGNSTVTQMPVRDWSASSSGWTDGEQLIKFCSEIIFRYSPTANDKLEDINKLEEEKSIDRNVLTETYIKAALYDASFLSRRASSGKIILGRDGSALKITNDNTVKGPGVLAAAPYKMFQNNVRGSFSTFTAFVSRFHEDFYQQIVTEGYTNPADLKAQEIRLKRYQSRNQAAVRRVALEFGESESSLAFPLKWKDGKLGYDEIINPTHSTRIGKFIEKYRYKPSLVPGSKPWQLPLQTSIYDFITGEDDHDEEGNLIVNRQTNAREWHQTEEALEKLVALATDSWAKDISGELSSAYKEGKLADKIGDMIGKFGTEISISFAYIVSLDDEKKTELMMFLVGLLSSYLMYIFYSLPRSETKTIDKDYDDIFREAVNEIAAYFSPGKGTFGSIKFKSPNNPDNARKEFKDYEEWSIYKEFSSILIDALGGEAPLLKKKRPKVQVAGLQQWNENRYETYWIAQNMLIKSEREFVDWFVEQNGPLDKVYALFVGREAAVKDRTRRPGWVFPDVESKEVKS